MTWKLGQGWLKSSIVIILVITVISIAVDLWRNKDSQSVGTTSVGRKNH
ncbi:hypothetical protein ACN08P_21145 [Photobacterium leiognathi subsp. mandapamensis]